MDVSAIIIPKMTIPIDSGGKISDQYSFIDKLPNGISGVVYENGKKKDKILSILQYRRAL